MSTDRMPVLFVGHGSPMNAIEDNEFSQTWEAIGKALPRPKAILCISAHWETAGPRIIAMPHPRTIHDFGGFPGELFEMEYAAPGSPELAKNIQSEIKTVGIAADTQWGLDHGTWSVLCRMFPAADIPVLQLSLDHTREGEYHYNLGRQLRYLREQGVLILGSGNLVHNLRLIRWNGQPFDWAQEFDQNARQWILDGNHEPLIHYEKQGRSAELASNSSEHFLPLLYTLALSDKEESVTFFNESIFAGSVSMRGIIIGQ